jgi:hypothetical protein
MLGDILLCALAAAGALFAAWCLGGWLLLPNDATVTLYAAKNGASLEKAARCRKWLAASGLVKGRFVIVDCGLDADGRKLAEIICGEDESALLCAREYLPEILKVEL